MDFIGHIGFDDVELNLDLGSKEKELAIKDGPS
jgi:hypothetical protein